jgi:hypothetical protein
LDFSRDVLEHQRTLYQACGRGSELERQACPNANLARVHPVDDHLDLSLWNCCDTTDCGFVAICVLGLMVSIWSRMALGSEWSRDVELKQGHKLVERGPYALVRHPIYTGHLLMGLGTAVGSGLLVAFAGLALFLVGFWIKLRQEERLLVRSFPVEYPAYRARVRAMVPYVL